MHLITQKLSHPTRAILFILAMALLSRMVILVAMQVVAPLLFQSPVHPEWTVGNSPHDFVPGYVPQAGWEVFSHWDGKWYRTIATRGYEFVNDGWQHAVAYFPLFPLLARGVMALGLPFEIAAFLVNNLAFLGALGVLYFWVEERQGTISARWATAALAWCPSSLFGTVLYTEGLFLLVTTQSLRAFDKQQYGAAAVWGALASATRVPGILLLPTFLFLAWREQRPWKAYLTGLATSIGLLLFCLHTAIQFGAPLAFLQTRKGWVQTLWTTTLQQALMFDRKSMVLILALMGCALLLWCVRDRLPPVALVYAICVLLLLLVAGSQSFYRYMYGVVSMSFGFGLVLARHPRIGYGIMGFFAVSLYIESLHFASWDWVRWD